MTMKVDNGVNRSATKRDDLDDEREGWRMYPDMLIAELNHRREELGRIRSQSRLARLLSR
jgi:hypothetical protein